MPCGDPDRVIEHFDRTYQETIVEAGISGSGDLVMVLAPLDGATWTIIMVKPGGSACLVASGTDWYRVVPEFEADD